MGLEKEGCAVIIPFLNEALGFNLYRTGLLFRRELAKAIEEYGLTPEQWTVMATLWLTGKPLNQSEIVDLCMKDKHTVSRIVQRLERDGLIEKKSDPHDARITIIRPTRKGESLKEKVPKSVVEHFDKVLIDYSDEEVDALVASLKRLRKTLGDE